MNRDIYINSFDDILCLFDSTDLKFKTLCEIITKYNESVNKSPLFIQATDRQSLKKDLQSYIEKNCKGFFLGFDPLNVL